MNPKTTSEQQQQPTTAHASPSPVANGPMEAWMEIPLATVRDVTTVDKEPEPQAQPVPNTNSNSSNTADGTTTTAGIRGGDDDYDDCCEVCCSSMVICLRCWLCCGCHYDD
ncbi:hypothetical protein PG990_003374 [Apiospora arundinis]